MVYFEIDVSCSLPVYQQIMDQMRVLVSRGMAPPGKTLPSVRQLAAELAVNPNTVAKAYQLLELEGTIVTIKRRGAFVGQSSSARAALARKRRINEVMDRLLDEAKRLGMSKEDIMKALADKDREWNAGREGEGSDGRAEE